ncbi:holliday junction DNA helicase RuvB, amino-terminal protein [Medicago truncatula]|uniref:Holliday junction DNA helicase RuvB, amino-terminal protein n=1 Tax=Medicago truncatula TaxID=3880 RepID=G7KHS4_MEDTR|nr:holliday junction DNA helicase RuvB, amino-terminal protein [Medicago truncatula]
MDSHSTLTKTKRIKESPSQKQRQTQTHTQQNKPYTHQLLYERLCPRNLDEVVGEDHLLANNSILCSTIQCKRLPSIILWGPPDTSKTTIAKGIVNSTNSTFYSIVSLSAVTSGVKDVRDVVEDAKKLRCRTNQTIILFVDEVHRFNK